MGGHRRSRKNQDKEYHKAEDSDKKSGHCLSDSSSAFLSQSAETLENSDMKSCEHNPDSSGNNDFPVLSESTWYLAKHKKLTTADGIIMVVVSNDSMLEEVDWIFENWTHLRLLADICCRGHTKESGCSHRPMSIEDAVHFWRSSKFPTDFETFVRLIDDPVLEVA